LLSQEIEYYTSGNGYSYEILVVNNAFDCIANQCLKGLIRTKFIDGKSEYDTTSMNQFLTSLNDVKYFGTVLTEKKFRYDETIQPLNFYRTYFYKESKEILFQIQLKLIYDRGLLKAKEIKVTDEDLILTDEHHLKYRYISKSGSKTNIPFPPELHNRPNNYYYTGINLCPDCKEKKIYILDENKAYLLEEKYKYEYLRHLGNELLLAKKNNHFGIITYENQVIIPLEYDEIEVKSGQSERTNIVIARKRNLYEVFNLKGESIFPLEYEDVRVRSVFRKNESNIERLFILNKNKFYGVRNLEGEEIIPFEYDEIKMYHSKYFKVVKNNLFGIISVNGDILVPVKYKNIKLDLSNKIFFMEVFDKRGKKQLISIMSNGDDIEKVNIRIK